MKELKVGDTVWLEWYGNMARQRKGKTESQITKLGRDYVYTIEGKFNKKTGWQQSDYTPNYRLWSSLEELENRQETETLFRNIRSFFDTGVCPCTLDQLRAIHAIIN